MIGYASRTGTRRNLTALRDAGWRLLVTPVCLRTEGMAYALDNGAWGAHISNRPWDADAFLRAVQQLGWHADFIVVPDVVGDARRTLPIADTWSCYRPHYTLTGVEPCHRRDACRLRDAALVA